MPIKINFDLNSLTELESRVLWSRIAEPGDETAASLIRQYKKSDTPSRDALILVAETNFSILGEKLAAANHPKHDLAVMQKLGTVLIPGDEQWPTGLNELAEPPYFLWVRGNVEALNNKAISVVGARASTNYGETVTKDIVTDLVDNGYMIVSGGAYGIDTASHRAALAANGKTIAVMPCGLDKIYPSGNEKLFTAILENGGALVGELPPSATPFRSRFLTRNRLIAALSDGLVVVEAATRSGALNTANHAIVLHKPLGAVPGPVTSMASGGTHQLIRDQKAILVTDATEVIEMVGK